MDIVKLLALCSVTYGILVIVTNFITEVCKRTFGWKKEIPTQITCLVISLILTIGTVLAVCDITSIGVTWYIIFGAIVSGFMVCAGAISGYDNIITVLAPYIKSLIDILKNSKGA